MHHFLEMTDQSQHRQNSLDYHPVVPFAALTHAQVRRVPALLAEMDVREDDHFLSDAINEMLE
jgi:hypothetical protein